MCDPELLSTATSIQYTGRTGIASYALPAYRIIQLYPIRRYRDRSGLVTRVSGHREDVSEDVDCFDYWLKRSESVPTSLCGECVTLPVLLVVLRYRGIKS